jgi:hypothetical protein
MMVHHRPSDDAAPVARHLHRWGHAVLRQGAASEPWRALDGLLNRLDALLRPLCPGAPPGLFAALSGLAPEPARVFFKCLVKTIVCNSDEATSLALSPRMCAVAQQYLDSKELYFENGSLRLHLCRDKLEVLDFHVDSAKGSDLPLLNCWLPMNRVLPGQEIRMVSLSHRIGHRGRQMFEALPDRLKWLLSSGRTDYELGDVHLWSGDTEHGRVLNCHPEAAIAMVFRYAARPLNSDWCEVDRAISDAQAVGSTAMTRELDELMTTLVPEAVELIRSKPEFSPVDCLQLVRSEHLTAHPSICRQLVLCLIYYYDRAGLGRRVIAGDGAAQPERPYWPEYMIEMYLLAAWCYFQQGMPDRAQPILTETVRRSPADEALLDKVVSLRSPALVEAMIQVHAALGMTDRSTRFASLRAQSSEARNPP